MTTYEEYLGVKGGRGQRSTPRAGRSLMKRAEVGWLMK